MTFSFQASEMNQGLELKTGFCCLDMMKRAPVSVLFQVWRWTVSKFLNQIVVFLRPVTLNALIVNLIAVFYNFVSLLGDIPSGGCWRRCSNLPTPVCGTNGETFHNQCVLVSNCWHFQFFLNWNKLLSAVPKLTVWSFHLGSCCLSLPSPPHQV